MFLYFKKWQQKFKTAVSENFIYNVILFRYHLELENL